MAVIDDIAGLKVEIVVGGQPLPEYDDDEDYEGNDAMRGQNSTSKYVEAISHAKFSIKYTFDSTFPYRVDDMAIAVYVDGKYVDSHVRRYAEFQHGYIAIFTGHRYQIGNQWFERELSFAKLSISELIGCDS